MAYAKSDTQDSRCLMIETQKPRSGPRTLKVESKTQELGPISEEGPGETRPGNLKLGLKSEPRTRDPRTGALGIGGT